MNKPQNIFLFLLLGLLLLYGVYNSRHLFLGPNLKVSYPKNGAYVYDELLVIEGVAKNAVFISINGRPITVDTAGSFKEKVILQNGYNDITIFANDRFRREEQELVRVYLRKSI